MTHETPSIREGTKKTTQQHLQQTLLDNYVRFRDNIKAEPTREDILRGLNKQYNTYIDVWGNPMDFKEDYEKYKIDKMLVDAVRIIWKAILKEGGYRSVMKKAQNKENLKNIFKAQKQAMELFIDRKKVLKKLNVGKIPKPEKQLARLFVENTLFCLPSNLMGEKETRMSLLTSIYHYTDDETFYKMISRDQALTILKENDRDFYTKKYQKKIEQANGITRSIILDVDLVFFSQYLKRLEYLEQIGFSKKKVQLFREVFNRKHHWNSQITYSLIVNMVDANYFTDINSDEEEMLPLDEHLVNNINKLSIDKDVPMVTKAVSSYLKQGYAYYVMQVGTDNRKRNNTINKWYKIDNADTLLLTALTVPQPLPTYEHLFGNKRYAIS